ncbi:MAG: SdpI family protein [Deltaproteobacteria bacterium]|nr:MAG: SdpI family protein [Deltaproteobacteria bacterium]
MLYFIIAEILIFVFLGFKLTKKQITRNGWIGYRTASTLASDENWYKANSILGKGLLAGAGIQVLSLVLLNQYIESEIFQGVIAGGIPLLVIAITAIIYKPSKIEDPSL